MQAQPAKVSELVDATTLGRVRQQLDAQLIGARTDRYSWWVHWRELADYILPRRYKWLITPNQGNRGSPINQKIIDNTATIAMRVLAAGMMSGITSPGKPWFRLTTGNAKVDEVDEVTLWLTDTRDRMLEVMAASNFYQGLAVMYQDLGVFGTAPMLIDEDYEDVIRCYNAAAGEYYLQNSERMQVNGYLREFVMTIQQVVARFGLDNCSPDVQAAYKNGGAALRREIIVAHAIVPNTGTYTDGDSGLTYLIPKSMPYLDIYWEWGKGQATNAGALGVRGRKEFPVIAPRWDIVANDPYGRSPGMDALGDIKQLQVEQKRKAQAIDKMVNPPMLADSDLKNEPATLIPGGVTYVVPGPNRVGFKPLYEVNPRTTELMEDIKEVQGRIKTTFYYDLFLMISQLEAVRTATEIDARREEKLIQLGPVLERFENEALDPAIDRIFSIMWRAGLIAPPPEQVARAGNVKVEYISMLAQAQKAAMTTGIERLFAFVGNLTAADPNALDNLDIDEAIDEYADLLGVSPKLLRAANEVQQMRQARAQAQQQQAAMQQGMAMVQGAETLSRVDVGGGQNAVSAMLGQAA